MGHDDMQRKTTRFHPHARPPCTGLGWYANLALNPAYEKTAAPFSKRERGLSRGGPGREALRLQSRRC